MMITGINKYNMPLYEIINTDDNTQHEVMMSHEKLVRYLNDNPHYKQVVCAPKIVSGVSGITHKTDAGFNEVMSKIAENNPYTPHAEKYGDKGVKATKTREAVNRARSNS